MDSGPWRQLNFDRRALDAADELHLSIAEPTLADGYNPYESFPNVSSQTGIRKHKDLRKLSEWIRARRQAEVERRDQASSELPTAFRRR